MEERSETITVIQYMRPNGRRVTQKASVTPKMAALAQKIMEAGYNFEAEVLSSGHVSIDCCDNEDQLSLGFCSNGSQVHETMDKVIQDAAKALGIKSE